MALILDTNLKFGLSKLGNIGRDPVIYENEVLGNWLELKRLPDKRILSKKPILDLVLNRPLYLNLTNSNSRVKT